MKEYPVVKIDMLQFGEKYYPKSHVKIGNNYHLYLLLKFNWFQKKMIKIFFGFEVEDIKENLIVEEDNE